MFSLSFYGQCLMTVNKNEASEGKINSNYKKNGKHQNQQDPETQEARAMTRVLPCPPPPEALPIAGGGLAPPGYHALSRD